MHEDKRRAFKRFMREMGVSHPVQVAYNEGRAVYQLGFGRYGMSPRYRNNPYPSGKRHDEFNRGRWEENQ